MPATYASEKNYKSQIINHQSQIKWYIPAVLLTVGIAIVSLWESPRLPVEISLSDKLMHGLMYAFLAAAWMMPVGKFKIKNSKSRIIPCVAVCLGVTVYGALLELLQHYCMQTRSGEWMDVLADFIGAAAGVAVIAVLELSGFRYSGKSK